MAMAAVDQHLVHRDHALVQLLDPPFDKSDLNPGTSKGTSRASEKTAGSTRIWAAMAFARLGDSRRVWELLAMITR